MIRKIKKINSIILQLLRKFEDIFKYLIDDGRETTYGINYKFSPLRSLNLAKGDKYKLRKSWEIRVK